SLVLPVIRDNDAAIQWSTIDEALLAKQKDALHPNDLFPIVRSIVGNTVRSDDETVVLLFPQELVSDALGHPQEQPTGGLLRCNAYLWREAAQEYKFSYMTAESRAPQLDNEVIWTSPRNLWPILKWGHITNFLMPLGDSKKFKPDKHAFITTKRA